jgi:hypothetical protein
MGIGYPKLEAIVQDSNGLNTPSYSNIPQSMVQQGLINSNAYSLWLDDINSATGSILFGGVDTAKYSGSLVTLNIVQESGTFLEMLVNLDGIAINANGQTQSALNTSTVVLLDSGSTLSYLPVDAAAVIYQAVKAEYDQRQGLAFVNCDLANSSTTMSFTFGGKSISVDMADMVLEGGITNSLDCTFGIVPQQASTTGQSSFTLGDSFIRNAYIVYDISNNQISLAQTARDATGSNIMEIANGTNGVPDVTGTASPSATGISGGANAVQGVGSSSSKGAAAPTPTAHLATWAGVAGAGLVLAAAL